MSLIVTDGVDQCNGILQKMQLKPGQIGRHSQWRRQPELAIARWWVQHMLIHLLIYMFIDIITTTNMGHNGQKLRKFRLKTSLWTPFAYPYPSYRRYFSLRTRVNREDSGNEYFTWVGALFNWEKHEMCAYWDKIALKNHLEQTNSNEIEIITIKKTQFTNSI